MLFYQLVFQDHLRKCAKKSRVRARNIIIIDKDGFTVERLEEKCKKCGKEARNITIDGVANDGKIDLQSRLFRKIRNFRKMQQWGSKSLNNKMKLWGAKIEQIAAIGC